jgi:hypothetical protein
MARAIVRFSLNGDYGSKARNQAVALLADAGFERVGTGSHEAYGAPQDVLVDVLQELLALLHDPPGRGQLDHLWVYLEAEESE